MPRTTKARRPHRIIEQLTRDLAQVQPSSRSGATLRARAESVLSTLADVDCAIMIANDWGRYVHVNKRAERVTGYTADELRRSSVWDITPDIRVATARRMWREFLKAGRMQGPYVVRHKTGRIISVEYVAIAHVLPGLHLSALLLTEDRPKRVRRPARKSQPLARRT